MNDKKQLECKLECRASASLVDSVASDLQKEDRKLKEFLDVRESDEQEADCNS